MTQEAKELSRFGQENKTSYNLEGFKFFSVKT